eukprot:TRINITY_DN2909_c0_g1_i1.p2 TRINITY_DN2909_c0_g1~~TRINITY_DN2909_c0_g1_i1.p2  ORF type:complete len:110 (+),score=22.34 TRINITY_DN2909_c0_g1_i1:25-330(+)
MIRRPPRSTPLYSSAASDVYKRQSLHGVELDSFGGGEFQDPDVVERVFGSYALLRVAGQHALDQLDRIGRYRLPLLLYSSCPTYLETSVPPSQSSAPSRLS